MAKKPGVSDAHVESALRGVHSSFRELIDKKQLAAVFAKIGIKGAARAGAAPKMQTPPALQTSPPLRDVFEWLRYSSLQTCCGVLIGQDPYPDGADGLCFSKRGAKTPPASLKPVLAALFAQKLAACAPRCDAARSDLRYLAAQGLLMCNTALTTEQGKVGAHIALWKPFMEDLLKKILSERGDLFLILWGKKAQEFAGIALKDVRHEGKVLKWSHPSPTADNAIKKPELKFVNCTNFAAVSDKIVWDGLRLVRAFSDGSIVGNGKADAVAGFAAVVVGGHFRRSAIWGRVPAAKFKYGEFKGITMYGTDEASGMHASEKRTPTVNRAELHGICWCLQILIWGNARGPVEIYSDSQYCVNTLTKWLPAARMREKTGKKGRPPSSYDNYDLLCAAEAMLGVLRRQSPSVTFAWTRAAHDVPCPADPKQKNIWKGNTLADRLAEKGRLMAVAGSVETAGPICALHL